MNTPITRRTAVTALGAVLATTATAFSESDSAAGVAPAEGRLNQSVCKWCYNLPLEELTANAKAMGIQSVELLTEKEWEVVQKGGLACAVAMGPSGIGDGWNRIADHDKLVKESERLLPLVKAANIPNMIVFSGNRRGLSDKDGIVNCAAGLKRITKLAEELGVTVIMELLNSKRDHKDYQCDHTSWGVELAKEVGSPRFKLLYDIYHMQIMEGDVIDTIQRNKDYIAHYHTGGVPGRAEIDDSQELNYKKIARAIADTGFKGYFAHEFIPRRTPMNSLKEAYQLCLV